MKEARARRLVRDVLGTDTLPPPGRTDPGATAHCAICLAEYRAGVEVCGDCDSPLEPYPTQTDCAHHPAALKKTSKTHNGPPHLDCWLPARL
jgi:hypothetical protein